MNHSLRLLTAAIIAAALHAQACADEVWTFQFTPTGSRPYITDCGECSSSIIGTRADVIGTFSLLLNRETGAGKLLELNDRLVNMVLVLSSPSGNVLQPIEAPSYGLFSEDLTLEQPQGHFIYQQNGLWRLTPDNARPDSLEFAKYDIWFTLNAATFSAYPSTFWVETNPRISGAFASLVSITTAGDFNADARVDARDYVSWRKSSGTMTKYTLWRIYYGSSGAAGLANGLVPEPSTALLSIGVAALLLMSRRRSRFISAFRSAIN